MTTPASKAIAKLGALIPLVVACLGATACSQRTAPLDEMSRIAKESITSNKILLAITNGCTLEEVTNVLRGGVFHEFTAAEPRGEYIALECRTSSDCPDFWLLFVNRRLSKVVRPVPPELDSYPYRGATASRVESWDDRDKKRIAATLGAQPLTHEQMLLIVNANECEDSVESSLDDDLDGRAAASSQLRHFNEATALRARRDYERSQELVVRYDGCRVRTGMDAGAVAGM